MGSLSLVIDGSVQYVARQFTGPSNESVIPKHTLSNAGLTLQTEDKRYALRFWAQNLFDKNYLNNVLEEAVGVLQVPGAPRTYGVTFSGKLF